MGEFGTLGYMRDEKVYLQNMPYRMHTYQSEFSTLEYDTLPKVSIYYVHADCDPKLLEWMLAHNDGVVLAGSGSGNYPDSIRRVLETNETSCVVVRASRILEGAVFDSDVFDPLRKTIPAYRLSPHKARILLMVAWRPAVTRNACAKRLKRIEDDKEEARFRALFLAMRYNEMDNRKKKEKNNYDQYSCF